MVILPCAWAEDGAALYATLPATALELADLRDPRPPAALVIDRASWWRARHMTGAMLRGTGEVVATDRLASGGRSADRIVQAAGAEPEGAALVRLRPHRVVWWRGWSSGTVAGA
jgi:hypothetical protein